MAISILRRAEHRPRLLRSRAGRLLAACCFLAVVAIAVAASKTSLLHARSIEVTGSREMSRAEIIALSGLDRSTNVLWFDEEAAERRLESSVWVSDAEVTASMPATIRIAVTERVPVAVASGGRVEALVAGDGVVLGASERVSATRGLPRIELTQAGALEGLPQSPTGAALALGAMDADLLAEVRRISVLFDGTLEVWLRAGTRIRFGAPSGLAPKARAIAQALAWAEAEGERIVSLSVVSPSAPAATLAP